MPPDTPKYFSSSEVREYLTNKELQNSLERAFLANDITAPNRQHHTLADGKDLLVMPAWREEVGFGIKLVSVFEGNPTKGLETINGVYVLFNRTDGRPLAFLDGAELTAMRSAATSALAAKHLARQDAKNYLIIGTGKLCSYFADAFRSQFELGNISIWGRNTEKAALIAKKIGNCDISCNLAKSVAQADIISTLTSSNEPILHGEWLPPGVHLDLVGSYRLDQREVDDATVQKSKIFVDTYEGAPNESRDLRIPLGKGIISSSSICDLSDLIGGRKSARESNDQITLFKSVGTAQADLVAACLCYENYNLSNNKP